MKHIIRTIALFLCMMTIAGAALAAPAGFLNYHGSRDEKRISITIDDCYDLNAVRAIHELSVAYDFPITYFVLGVQLKDEDKALWEEIIAHGSEIGNHSWKHPYLTRIQTATARNQILLTQERIDELLGYHYPLRLFRPPFGKFNEKGVNILDLLYQSGVEKTIMWDVDYTDPQTAFNETENGSILLFHTNFVPDLECLKVLIPMLLEEGYELVTVSELLHMDPLETSEEKYVFPYR